MRIIDHTPEHQPAFKRINIAWIEKSFEVEDVDLEVLDRPEANILAPGGVILLALSHNAAGDEEVAGTCALVVSAPGVYQMAKMAVDERFRGQGIGRALAEAAIVRARGMGAVKVVLYSNTKGSSTAIALYRKLGFRERPLPTRAYRRADIYMELELA